MKSLAALVTALLAASTVTAEISGSGDWYAVFNASDLASGAGSDLRSETVSASGVTILTVTTIGMWRVSARRSAQNWPAGAVLWVRRSSNGSGTGTIEGGDAYVPVGESEIDLFSGSDARSGIAIQFKLTGVSTKLTPGTYASLLTFFTH